MNYAKTFSPLQFFFCVFLSKAFANREIKGMVS